MTVTSRMSVLFGASLAGVVDLGTTQSSISRTMLAELANGVGVGQADRAYSSVITLAGSATQDLDLAGPLLDALGGVFSLARVKGLLAIARDTNVNNVVIGAAATNPFVGLLGATHTVTLRPGAMFAAIAGAKDANGYAVTAGTGDLLRVANGAAGTSVILDLMIIGASA